MKSNVVVSGIGIVLMLAGCAQAGDPNVSSQVEAIEGTCGSAIPVDATGYGALGWINVPLGHCAVSDMRCQQNMIRRFQNEDCGLHTDGAALARAEVDALLRCDERLNEVVDAVTCPSECSTKSRWGACAITSSDEYASPKPVWGVSADGRSWDIYCRETAEANAEGTANVACAPKVTDDGNGYVGTGTGSGSGTSTGSGTGSGTSVTTTSTTGSGTGSGSGSAS